MIPTFSTPWGEAATFPLVASFAIVLFFVLVIVRLAPCSGDCLAYILPKLVIAGLGGVVLAAFTDALFKIPENHGFRPGGICFLGGLLGAVATLYATVYVTGGKSPYCIKTWLNFLTLPFMVFHAVARLACFLGGCCYGRVTQCFLGVVFPDQPANGIVHGGQARFPTQLFEMALVLLLMPFAAKSKHPFNTYLIGYAMGRFVIEFFRGDFRGASFLFLSPAQIICLTILAVAALYHIRTAKHSA